MAILKAVADEQGVSYDLLREIERLRAENAKLKAGPQAIGLKIGEKGGLSVYGLGRFPVTLYKGQWAKLAAKMPDILAFIAENEALLATKD